MWQTCATFRHAQFLSVGTIDIDPLTQDDRGDIKQEGQSGKMMMRMDVEGSAQGDDFINVPVIMHPS